MIQVMLIIMELSLMFKRRLGNPLGIITEGLVAGAFLLIIEKMLGGSGSENAASGQIMFTASVLALPAMQGMHRLIAEESASGTIETLFQVPGGPMKAFLAKDVCSMISILMTIPFMLLVMATFSRIDLSSYSVYIFPMLIMRAGLLGMGIILGSATILFKKTAAIVNLSSIIMMTTSLSAGFGKGILGVLAATSPHGLLAICIRRGDSPLKMLPWIALVSAIWIGVGCGVYNLAVRRAKRFGLLINS
jgi:hypothetical protein